MWLLLLLASAGSAADAYNGLPIHTRRNCSTALMSCHPTCAAATAEKRGYRGPVLKSCRLCSCRLCSACARVALHWQRMQQHPAASIPSSKLTKGARRHAAAMLGDDSGTGAAEGWRTGGRAKRRRHRDGAGGDASPGIQLGVQLGHLLLLTSFLLFVPILWAVFSPPRDAYD
mmetsp:Transcript_43648/g.140142  ORF Transcript_43648/g.140142 Transcript_43648/m.140142 type:complete len:173 (-) Transcript_43648:1420-1938(-)